MQYLPSLEYDYVIVGGGTAGLVVASPLSEEPNVRVLVLEAGISHTGNFDVDLPAGWPCLLGSEADWQFATVPQVRQSDNANCWR